MFCFELQNSANEQFLYIKKIMSIMVLVYLLTQIKLIGPHNENNKILMVYSKRQLTRVKTSWIFLKQKTRQQLLTFKLLLSEYSSSQPKDAVFSLIFRQWAEIWQLYGFQHGVRNVWCWKPHMKGSFMLENHHSKMRNYLWTKQ